MFPSTGALCVFAVLVLTGCAPQGADIEGLALLSAAKGLAVIVLSWGDRPIDGFSTTELLGVINQVGPQAYSSIFYESLPLCSLCSVLLCLFVSLCFVPCHALRPPHSLTHSLTRCAAGCVVRSRLPTECEARQADEVVAPGAPLPRHLNWCSPLQAPQLPSVISTLDYKSTDLAL